MIDLREVEAFTTKVLSRLVPILSSQQRSKDVRILLSHVVADVVNDLVVPIQRPMRAGGKETLGCGSMFIPDSGAPDAHTLVAVAGAGSVADDAVARDSTEARRECVGATVNKSRH